ncbi:MAG: histidine phosphatase family protein, partial [Demequinaceae bacterium]|nr:histidine phosphatase family protein [Demequinaceae bacterium]
MHSSNLDPAATPEPDVSDLGTEDASGEAPTPRGPSLFHAPHPGHASSLTLVFVRHGVTDMTTTHMLSGSTKPGPKLNAEGRLQVNAAADAVYRMGRDRWRNVPLVSRVIASPM